jgi:hypothetical protein
MAAMDQTSLIMSLTTRTMRGELPLGELCSLCEAIYTSFNAAATTPDTHMEEFLAKHRIGFPGDRQFICQVFYGMTRYKKLLHALIQGFYFANRYTLPAPPPCSITPRLPSANPVGYWRRSRGYVDEVCIATHTNLSGGCCSGGVVVYSRHRVGSQRMPSRR